MEAVITNIQVHEKPSSILLVEDSEGDIFLIQKLFQKSQIKNKLDVANDGEAALAFLKKNVSLPDIILLDINLPKLNGKQLLQEIRNDPKLKSSLVIYMTGSPAEKEVLKQDLLQPDAYIIKPLTLEKLGEALKISKDFWFGILTLPAVHPKEDY